MDLAMIEKTKEIVDEINKLRSKVFCGEEIDRNEAIKVVISLYKTIFHGLVNDGVHASVFFGEYSILDSILDNLIYKCSGFLVFFQKDGPYDSSYGIKQNDYVLFERKLYSVYANKLNPEGGTTDIGYYYDEDKLEVYFYNGKNKISVIYHYDEDGLVRRRDFHESYSTGKWVDYFKSYEISRKMTIERDLVNPTLVYIKDGLYVSNGSRLIFKKENESTKFLGFSSYFDLAFSDNFRDEQISNILHYVHCYHNSAFRSDRGLACFFPQIKESFINRVKNVPDISYKRKRTKFNRFKNRNNEE